MISSSVMGTDRVECSIWTNGQSGWGIRVLGGNDVRKKYFDRKESPVTVELDITEISVNIDKNSFWNGTCGELIHKSFRDFSERNELKPSDRVWLKVLEPLRRFRLEKT
jgi:hypothetical protein